MYLLFGALTLELEKYMLPCMTKGFLGFDCPGCGFQRSALLFIKGDFLGAFYMYPAIYNLIVLFGFLIVNKFYNIKYSNTITIILSIATIVTIFTNYFIKITH